MFKTSREHQSIRAATRLAHTSLRVLFAAAFAALVPSALDGILNTSGLPAWAATVGFGSFLLLPLAAIGIITMFLIVGEFAIAARASNIPSKRWIALAVTAAAIATGFATNGVGRFLVSRIRFSTVWAVAVSLTAVGLFFIIASATIALLLRLYRWRTEIERLTRQSEEGLDRLVSLVIVTTSSLMILFYGVLFVASSHPMIRGTTSRINWHLIAIVILLGCVTAPMSLMLPPLSRATRRVLGRSGQYLPSTPLAVLFALCMGGALLLVFWYSAVSPRLGYFDVTPFLYVFLLVPAGAVGWWLVTQPKKAARVTSAIAGTVCIASMLYALQVRKNSSILMLDIWAESQTAGAVIDRVFDPQRLRESVPASSYALERKPGQKSQGPNIVFISIDTLRADITPLYGGLARMPALSELAEDGTTFEWAFAPSNVTRRSLPAFSVGLDPPRIRGRVAGWALRMDPRHVTISDRLRGGGYHTVAYFCCRSQIGPDHKLGLHWGFDKIQVVVGGMKLAKQTAEWLSTYRGDKPFFLWVHFLEPHNPRRPTKHKTIKDRYVEVVEQTDTQLHIVTQAIRKHHGDNTVVIVSSDHGEALGEHGQPTHSSDVYNSQVRVPLVVWGKNIATQRVPGPVTLVDLTATILDLAGFKLPDDGSIDGVSFLSTLRGEPMAPRSAVTYMVRDRWVPRSAEAVIKLPYKLIRWDDGAAYQLFDLSVDPNELNDIAEDNPDIVARLKEALSAKRRRVPVF